ncbi:hypothetical protein JCM10213_002470 [Rhodosporidiobolus nylandii]
MAHRTQRSPLSPAMHAWLEYPTQRVFKRLSNYSDVYTDVLPGQEAPIPFQPVPIQSYGGNASTPETRPSLLPQSPLVIRQREWREMEACRANGDHYFPLAKELENEGVKDLGVTFTPVLFARIDNWALTFPASHVILVLEALAADPERSYATAFASFLLLHGLGDPSLLRLSKRGILRPDKSAVQTIAGWLEAHFPEALELWDYLVQHFMKLYREMEGEQGWIAFVRQYGFTGMGGRGGEIAPPPAEADMLSKYVQAVAEAPPAALQRPPSSHQQHTFSPHHRTASRPTTSGSAGSVRANVPPSSINVYDPVAPQKHEPVPEVFRSNTGQTSVFEGLQDSRLRRARDGVKKVFRRGGTKDAGGQ